MKTLHLIIILIVTVASGLTLSVVIPQESSNQSVSCRTELKEYQYDLELSKKHQVESIVMTDPTIKKIIDNTSYCEFMSLGTLYTENGSYQILNINLNNTKLLTAQVSLQNSSVVSYDLSELTRITAASLNYYSIYPYLYAAGIGTVGIVIAIFLFTRKRK
jgi:hypothetical protein